MKTINIKIEMLSYWHVGSGMGRGAVLDAIVLRSEEGLPYLPGRTLKGLLRDGMQTAEDAGLLVPGTTNQVFGSPAAAGDPSGSEPGLTWVTDAVLPRQERVWLASAAVGHRNALFDSFASTSLDAHGMANDQTLRTIELTVPVCLDAMAEGPDHPDWVSAIKKAAIFVRALGSHRNRGLGRCKITISE